MHSRLNLPEFYEAQGREEDYDHGQHQEHSFRHKFPLGRKQLIHLCCGIRNSSFGGLCFRALTPKMFNHLISELGGRIRSFAFLYHKTAVACVGRGELPRPSRCVSPYYRITARDEGKGPSRPRKSQNTVHLTAGISHLASAFFNFDRKLGRGLRSERDGPESARVFSYQSSAEIGSRPQTTDSSDRGRCGSLGPVCRVRGWNDWKPV